MSEKASLLTPIPPVKKSGLNGDTSPTSTKPKNEGKISLLSQTNDAGSASKVSETEYVPAVKPSVSPEAKTEATKTEAAESVISASEVVPDEPSSISTFQFLTYGSFVLNFVLAGIAALILFKKASKLIEERFIASTKALGIACVLIMLHGFYATYLYASYLNGTVSSEPLFLTMVVWVLIGPAVGFITRNLLARGEKPNRKAAFFDAGVYGLIFFLTACGVSSTIKTNAALIAAILAAFLMIVPLARAMTAFKVAKARHKELKETSVQVSIYGLLILPALLPVLAFAHVCGLSDTITLILINLITMNFVMIVGLSMITSANIVIPETHAGEAVAGEAVAEEAGPDTLEETKEVPASAPQQEKIVSGNPNDPIIQFLNSEEGAAEKPAAPKKPGKDAKSATEKPQPRKPDRPDVKPPKKPSPASEDIAAPRIKAPAKPKKRF